MEQTLVKETEVTALMQILRETGIKGVMSMADCIVLHHLVERGLCNHERAGMIQTLREGTNMEYSEIMELVNKYERMKSSLPSYSLALNQQLDKQNAIHDAEVGFEWIGKRLLGIVKNGRGGYDLYDGSGNHLIKLAGINERYHINWNNHWVVHPAVLHWTTKAVKEIKERIW
jgi:hypothetical protein